MAGVPIGNGGKDENIRVILAVSVLDGHDRGLKYIAKRLSEDGMEVIYLSYEQIESVAEAAVQEDVEVIGVSSSTGAHMAHMADLVAALKEKEATDFLLMIGGIIPTADIPDLEKLGIKGVFGPGTLDDEVVNFIRENLKK
ncbi:cobalamin B12-binding domain-containing protein [Thermodesulfobacteriota bacterium]